MEVVRTDVPLNAGYGLVVLDNGEAIFLRLIGSVDGRRTYLTPKLPLTLDQVEALQGPRPLRLTVKDVEIWTERHSVTVQIDGHCCWGGRATLVAALDQVVARRAKRPTSED